MTAPADIDDLAMLAEFAQLAMARARAASARAEAVEAEGGDPEKHLAAMDRMGRAMRLALSLRRRFIGEAEHQSGRRIQARKEQLKAALTPAIRLHAHFRDRQDLDWALAHRLETEGEVFAGLSFEAGLARLARLLGLPDEVAPAEPGEDRAARPDDSPEGGLGSAPAPDPTGAVHGIAARASATGPPG